MLMNLLIWLMCNMLTGNNNMISAIVVYVCERVLLTVRKYLGEKNIALKSQVDERFII